MKNKTILIILVCILIVGSTSNTYAISLYELKQNVVGMISADYRKVMDTSQVKQVYPMGCDVARAGAYKELQENAELFVRLSGGKENLAYATISNGVYKLGTNNPPEVIELSINENNTVKVSNNKIESNEESTHLGIEFKDQWSDEQGRFMQFPLINNKISMERVNNKVKAYSKALINKLSVNLTRRYSYKELESVLKAIGCSDCAGLEIVGVSVEGRNIYNLTVGAGDKVVMFSGGVHARESSNPVFLTKFAVELIQAYEKNTTFYGYNVKELLSKYTFQIMPIANPDGYEKVQFGYKEFATAKSNARHVDINRNFPSYSSGLIWPGMKQLALISYTPSNYYYAGKSLGSEPETQAMMRWMYKYMNEKTHIYIDFHSGGSIVYDYKPDVSEERNSTSKKAGVIFRKISGYSRANDEVTGRGTDGSTTDFAYNLSMGMTFNTALGRYTPKNNTDLIKVVGNPVYKFAILAVETLKTGLSQAPLNTTVPAKKNKQPTLGDQNIEWTRAKLPQAILETLKYN